MQAHRAAAPLRSLLVGCLAVAAAACGGNTVAGQEGSSASSGDGATGAGGGVGPGTGGAGGSTGTGAGTGGAGGSAPVDKAAPCTGTFGDALTASFGRLDGTVLAVVRPVDTQCPMPNDDHVIVEVTMNGAVYRVVVNVQSSFGDPRVQYLAIEHALPGAEWSEGWHTGLTLDYAGDFGVHAGEFTPVAMDDLSDTIADSITLGQRISAYAESSGGASAHKVHRTDGKTDGALVLDPGSPSSRALLFHFSDQVF